MTSMLGEVGDCRFVILNFDSQSIVDCVARPAAIVDEPQGIAIVQLGTYIEKE